jgi:hypothetical protein
LSLGRFLEKILAGASFSSLFDLKSLSSGTSPLKNVGVASAASFSSRDFLPRSGASFGLLYVLNCVMKLLLESTHPSFVMDSGQQFLSMLHSFEVVRI